MNVINSPIGGILTSFYEFKIPQTPKSRKNSVNYDRVIGGDLQPEVRKMLKVASQQRITLIQGLSYVDAKPDPRNIIAAVDAYLPNVWKIQRSLEFSQSTKIKLEAPLEFEWTSVLSPDDRVRATVQGVFVFEVSYVLIIRGLAHYNNAKAMLRNLTDSSSTEQVLQVLKNAMQELRVGAGIFDHLATNVLPNWRKPPAMPPAELTVEVARGLSWFYLCMAQRLFIVAALIKGSVSIVPRLFGGLKEKSNLAVREFCSLEGFQVRVTPTLYEEPQLMYALCGIWTMKYKGVTLHDKVTNDEAEVDNMEDTFGQAVAYMGVAAQRARNAAVTGLSMKKRMTTYLNREAKEVASLHREYQEENNTIYFGRFDSEEIEDITKSQNVFNLTAIPFHMPEVTALSFEEIPKPEGWGEPVRNFDPSKHKNEQITADGTFIPPGVDPEIFKALPEDVRNELVEQYFAEQEAAAGAKGKGKKKKKKKKS